MFGRHLEYFATETVDSNAHDTGTTILAGFDVDVGTAELFSLDDDAVQQLDDGGGGSRAFIILLLGVFNFNRFIFKVLEYYVEAADLFLFGSGVSPR